MRAGRSVSLDDLSTGAHRNVGAARPARVPSRRRLGAVAVRRERARLQVRRRVPPGRSGRRAADRGAAGAHDGHERAGHRDRPRVLQQVRQARARRVELGGLRRPPRGTALSENDRRIYGPVSKRRWLYADSKAIDEFLALGFHQDAGSTASSSACSTRSGRSSRATGWSSPASSSARSPARRSRSRRRQADALVLPRSDTVRAVDRNRRGARSPATSTTWLRGTRTHPRPRGSVRAATEAAGQIV